MAMNGYSDELAIKLQGHFTGTDYAEPTGWYVGLSSSSLLSTGADWTEETIGVGAYARLSIAARGGTSPQWSAVGGSPTFSVYNDIDAQFVTATADWLLGVNMLSAAVWTIATQPVVGTDLIFGGDLVTPKAIVSGTTAVFLAGQLKISCSNS